MAIESTQRGEAEVKVIFSNQDPYSKERKILGTATRGGDSTDTQPRQGRCRGVDEAALPEAIKTAIGEIKDDAKKP